MPTKDELEAENAALREQLALATARDITSTGTSKVVPARPVDADGAPVLSEGERQALIEHGTTVSPFTGEQLNALDEGVEPGNPTALARATLERRPAEVVPDGPAPSGDPA